MIARAIDHIRHQGWQHAAICGWHVAYDRWFDWHYRTQTIQPVALTDLTIHSANRGRGVDYMPTRAKAFLQCAKQLDVPIDATFVDLGAGKGKVLLLAALAGFRKIIGVEFSSELSREARRNVHQFQQRACVEASIEVVETDVLDWTLPREDTVFFVYHAFDDVVLLALLERMRASYEVCRRDLWLLYHGPVFHELVEEQGLFSRWKRAVYGSCDFALYRLTEDDQRIAVPMVSGFAGGVID